MKNPGGALKIGARINTAVVSENPKAVFSTKWDVKKLLFIIPAKDNMLESLHRFSDIKMTTTKLHPCAPVEPVAALSRKEIKLCK